MHCYQYPRPAVTTDIIVFGYKAQTNELSILLIQRKNEPFAGYWAMPGGFLDLEETVEHCAERELKEETTLTGLQLEQLITASKPGRDPRGHTVTVAFWTIISQIDNAIGADDAAEAKWFQFNTLPHLAFDHDEIIHHAINKLKFRVNIYQNFPEFFKNLDTQAIQNIQQLLQKF